VVYRTRRPALCQMNALSGRDDAQACILEFLPRGAVRLRLVASGLSRMCALEPWIVSCESLNCTCSMGK
jgi:hypothetical protein